MQDPDKGGPQSNNLGPIVFPGGQDRSSQSSDDEFMNKQPSDTEL